jgi:hypothetical protein
MTITSTCALVPWCQEPPPNMADYLSFLQQLCTLIIGVKIPIGTCMSTLIVCLCYAVCVCACNGLVLGWSPAQGVVPSLYKIHNFGITSGKKDSKEPNQ